MILLLPVMDRAAPFESMTYSQKLKDPRWQRKRLEIFDRDNFTCRVCGATDKTLHVHHIRYIKDRAPWDYHEWYFVTLCENCHKETEDEISGCSQKKYNGVIEEKERTSMEELMMKAPEYIENFKIDHQMAILCWLALKSHEAQLALKEQWSEDEPSSYYVNGSRMLHFILNFSPNPNNPNESIDCINSLPKDMKDAWDYWSELMPEGTPADGRLAATQALQILNSTYLLRRDAEVKSQLKKPGLTKEHLAELLAELKDIRKDLVKIRCDEISDDLPESTWKPTSQIDPS